MTAADEQDRAQVSELVKRVQEETGETVEIAFVDQGYTGENAADAAEEHGIRHEVAPLPTAKKGFVLLPRRWAVETLAGLHFPAFVILMLKNVAEVLA